MKKLLTAILFAASLPSLAAAPFVFISGTGLYDDTHGTFSGTPVDMIRANLKQTFTFQVKDATGFDQINLVKIVFWDTNFATPSSNNSAAYKAEYVYFPQTRIWALRPGSPDWVVSETYCSAPASTNSGTNLMRMTLVFGAGGQSQEEKSVKNWRITVMASNQSGSVTNLSRSFFLERSRIGSSTAGSSLAGIPNPYSISQDGTITFEYQSNADTDVTLKIYTIYGEPVKTIVENQAVLNGFIYDTWTWDGKNGAGLAVASGIYSAILTTKSGTQQALVFNFVLYR